MPKRSHLLFVYGSLLPGETNHAVLEQAGATFLSPAHSADSIYDMYDDGESPFVVKNMEKILRK